MKKILFILLLISVLAIGCTQVTKKADTTSDMGVDVQETSSDLELEGIDDLGADDAGLEGDLDEIEDSLDFDF